MLFYYGSVNEQHAKSSYSMESMMVTIFANSQPTATQYTTDSINRRIAGWLCLVVLGDADRHYGGRLSALVIAQKTKSSPQRRSNRSTTAHVVLTPSAALVRVGLRRKLYDC